MIGKTITLNEVPVTIIGVNPEYFTGVEPGAAFDIWAPLSLHYDITGRPLLENPNSFSIPMMGRLKPGISDEEAQSELDAIFQARLDADYPGIAVGKRPWFVLQPGARGLDYLTEQYEQPLLAVLALAGLVLLIACVNVANLLLAKAAVRQREVSLRLALGAGRWRIVRHLLTEGLLLASIAGGAGVLIGYGTRNGIPALLARPWRPSPFDTAFDLKVLLISIGLTFLTGLLFSLAPIWQSRRVEVNESLKDGSRGTASLSKLRIGRLLVAGEIALSVLLLAGTVLCVKTFTNLRGTPLGMSPQGVVLFELEPPRLRYPADRLGALLEKVQAQLELIPGVQSATFTGDRAGAWVGRGSQRAELTYSSYARSFGVGSRFFETMRIPILYGRAIDKSDRETGVTAAVVNQAFGRRFFHSDNPVGRTFTGFNPVPGTTDGALISYRIVGVCANWRAGQVSLRDPIPPAFYPALLPEPPPGRQDFEMKVADPSAAAIQQVVRQMRKVVQSIDPDLSVMDVRTQVQEIQGQLSQERFLASLALVFGGLALVLAAIGIYGVIAYGVARRTNEIGIRVALGARPPRIVWMVLRETLGLAAAGVAIGAPAVLAFGPVLDHILAPPYRTVFAYGMKASDPRIAGIAVLAIAVVSCLAGYLPARRAARVDPLTSLRHD